MDQALYDYLNTQRQAGTLPQADAQDFDALQGAGAFQQFQPQPQAAAPSPVVAQPQGAGAVPADPNDMTDRPQVEAPQGAPPSEAYTGGTVPRGLSYENTQRDYPTGLADRLGLPPLAPRDIGQLGQGMDVGGFLRAVPGSDKGEFLTRLLARDPNRENQLPRALEAAALLPSAITGSGAEAIAGRPAGDATQYLTNALIPYLLGMGYAPRTMAGLTGGGIVLDLGRQILHSLGR
jgi:hypothetical protein